MSMSVCSTMEDVKVIAVTVLEATTADAHLGLNYHMMVLRA